MTSVPPFFGPTATQLATATRNSNVRRALAAIRAGDLAGAQRRMYNSVLYQWQLTESERPRRG